MSKRPDDSQSASLSSKISYIYHDINATHLLANVHNESSHAASAQSRHGKKFACPSNDVGLTNEFLFKLNLSIDVVEISCGQNWVGP